MHMFLAVNLCILEIIEGKGDWRWSWVLEAGFVTLPSTQGYFADTQGYRPPSNHRNHPSTSQGYFADTQGYRPDLSNLSRNNIDLNQGLPEHQTSGSGGRGARNINNNQSFNHGFTVYQGFPNQQGNPNQSGRGRIGGQRVILPTLTINEGGRSRSTTTRAARNVSRGRGGRGGISRGKEILVDPEPDENE
ncbi:hypothetical protein P8452_32844 [Trifolium repens]|nr:hypothetical protein P8452_32844 [Trifolium repens]